MRTLLASLLAAIAVTAPALAQSETADPGNSPGAGLMRNSLASAAHEVNAAAPFTLTSPEVTLKLGETSLGDIASKLGGTTRHTGDAATGVYWLCYISPKSGSKPPTLYWFGARDTGHDASPLTAVALEAAPADAPANCPRLDSPLVLETGVPEIGATSEELERKFGKADKDPTGTIGYVFKPTEGAQPDDPMTTTPLLKYALKGDVVAAVSFSVVERVN